MNVVSVPDLATIDQQLEQHAVNVERIQRDAVYEIGRELAAAQELHKYQREGGGFTGWLAERLPQLSQTTAYRCIDVFKNIDPAIFPLGGNISAKVLEQVAKAEPDVQAMIAERVAAGEIFTAAKVKELREDAKREAAESSRQDVHEARTRVVELESQIAQDSRDTDKLEREIAKLKKLIKKHEDDIAEVEKSLPDPQEAEKIAAKMGDGVVLGSDMKFHSGKTVEERALSADYMTLWAIMKEFCRDDLPLPGRAAAGCPAVMRGQLLKFCDEATSYIERLKESIHGVQTNDDQTRSNIGET